MVEEKVYLKENFNIDESLKKQANDIIFELEKRYNDEENSVYKNEDFRKYIDNVKIGDVDKIFHPEFPLFLTLFEIAVLEYGSYNFIEILLINLQEEKAKSYLEYIDSRITEIQNAIMDSVPSSSQMLQKAYCNFLKNFAPQRLSYYISSPVNYEILNGMIEMERVSSEESFITDAPELSKNVLEFNKKYSIKDILKLLELNEQYNAEIDEKSKKRLCNSMDNITKKGISIKGNNIALLKFAKWNFNETYEKLADNIVIKLMNNIKDISEDFEILLENIREYKNNCSLDDIYSKNVIFHKLLQILKLEILPNKEKNILNDFIDNELGRKDISQIDMSNFDLKMKNNQFSDEEFKEFYKSLILLTIKEGEMPIKYNEFLISKLIDEKSEFLNELESSQRIIILEYFAIIKSKQLLGKRSYVSFSSNNLKENKLEFIKLNPVSMKNKSMSTVLNIITIFHELRCKQQKMDITSNNFNHLEYMILKERIFKNIDIDYYDKNYSTMYDEFDAEHFALSKTLNFIKTLPLDKEFYKSKKCQELLDIVNKKFLETKQGFKRTKNRKQKDGKLVNVEDSFDQLMFECPELIKKNPIFKIEYDDDGVRKSTKQVFQEFIDTLKVDKNRCESYDLYKYILYSRAGRDEEECVELNSVEIPKNLNYSTRSALEKLKTFVSGKNLD